jgi:hypothetical protein
MRPLESLPPDERAAAEGAILRILSQPHLGDWEPWERRELARAAGSSLGFDLSPEDIGRLRR